ncbi:hypothetical protein EON63_07380 [archaeon]|nr:MAG: hypothetical protein EON63_07380 [archaeon]
MFNMLYGSQLIRVHTPYTIHHQANELERISRDLRVHQILEGTSEIMRLIVGRGVVG